MTIQLADNSFTSHEQYTCVTIHANMVCYQNVVFLGQMINWMYCTYDTAEDDICLENCSMLLHHGNTVF